jgi:palmitoyltransferase
MFSIIYVLFGFAVTVLYTFVTSEWAEHSIFGHLHMALFYSIAIIALVSHARAARTNPGRVPKNAEPLEKEGQNSRYIYRECRYCESYRPPRAHHCTICDACIVKLDHHCPWTGQCIGIGNHKYFMLFVSYTIACSSYIALILMYRWAACHWNFSYEGDTFCEGRGRGWVIGLVVTGSLMFIFNGCIIVDQMDTMSYQRTAFAALAPKDKERHTKASANLRETFGGDGRFNMSWLLPTTPYFETEDWERMVGFTVGTSSRTDVEMGSVDTVRHV